MASDILAVLPEMQAQATAAMDAAFGQIRAGLVS